MLAPHSPLRAAVTARAGLPCDGSAGPIIPLAPGVSLDAGTADTPPAAHARYLWAVLIARIYAILPLIWPVCGNDMRLIAAVTEPEPVRRILLHVGEPTAPPPVSPARSPPLWDTVDWDQTPVADPENGDRAPEFQFDQTVSC